MCIHIHTQRSPFFFKNEISLSIDDLFRIIKQVQTILHNWQIYRWLFDHYITLLFAFAAGTDILMIYGIKYKYK